MSVLGPYPPEIDVYSVPHNRMKHLINSYTEKLSEVNLCDGKSLKLFSNQILSMFLEFKCHEQIENEYIISKLQQKLFANAHFDRELCCCHSDKMLFHILELVYAMKEKTFHSVEESHQYGTQLKNALDDFTDVFLPHMLEEEVILQPLLMQYFEYEELKRMKAEVIKEHFNRTDSSPNTFEGELDPSLHIYNQNSNGISLDEELLHCFEKEEIKSAVSNCSKTENFNPFDSLPDELILHIFKFLNQEDLLKLSLMNRNFHILTKKVELWQRINFTEILSGLNVNAEVFKDNVLRTSSLLNHAIENNDLRSMNYESSLYYGELQNELAESVVLNQSNRRAYKIYSHILHRLIPNISSSLKQLIFNDISVTTDEEFKSLLASCKNLEYLDVSYTKVGSKAFKNACFGKLKYLDLTSCDRFGDEGLHWLTNALMDQSNVANSSCYTCKMKPVETCKECLLLKNSGHYSLSYLSLSGCCDISDSALKKMADSNVMNSISSLNLSGCVKLTEKGIEYITSKMPKLIPSQLAYCNSLQISEFDHVADGCHNVCSVESYCCQMDVESLRYLSNNF